MKYKVLEDGDGFRAFVRHTRVSGVPYLTKEFYNLENGEWVSTDIWYRGYDEQINEEFNKLTKTAVRGWAPSQYFEVRTYEI